MDATEAVERVVQSASTSSSTVTSQRKLPVMLSPSFVAHGGQPGLVEVTDDGAGAFGDEPWVVARPMPEAPPVTIAVLPASRPWLVVMPIDIELCGRA